ncbi:MAG TPA: single-stranded DNA-binding protein [bacterium]|nr:single-stranded DNA-binding protein [bacterium]
MINKVLLLGRLGKDPEIKVIEGGRRVLNLTMATTEYYKKKNSEGFVEDIEWHSVSFWSDIIIDHMEKNIKKGDLIYVEGKIRRYVYEDSNGNKNSRFTIKGDIYKLIKKYVKKNVENK